MEHPKAVGDRTTLAVLAALYELGYAILMPFGENTRYDLAIDDGERVYRVQCKTGRLRRGAVLFNTCSSYAHHPHPKVIKRDYAGEIDFFAVHCPETTDVYLVPIEDVATKRIGSLRVFPSRNNQQKGIRDANDYLVAAVSVLATAGLRATSGGSAPCA
jgi:hypothetical protein